jgi:hypothetical protein
MCARRFLLVIFWLVLISVAAAFAIYQFGQQVLIKTATPQGHFQAAAAGGGPDYTKLENWLARPDLPNNPSDWLPEGVAAAQGGSAAIFYIHPTTYLERDRWNATLAGNSQSNYRTRLFVQSQASALTSAGMVWAPRYRQAAFGAFLLKSDDARNALDLAYSDVVAAFDEFLKQNPNKPLILAGHSQGSLHLSRLLVDRRDVLKSRLVAAYVVGWPISVTADLPAMGIRACTHAEETGCLLSWQTFAEPANPDLVLDAWQGTRGPSGVRRTRRDMLCTNPITGTRNGNAPAVANPGTLVPSADFASAALTQGDVGAHCMSGFLMLDGEPPALGPYVLPGNNYHVYDYALFWGAIRQDAARRLNAWQRQ